jgi:hypothetical protein
MSQEFQGATPLTLITPGTYTTTETGTGVSILDYDGVGLAVLASAAGTGSAPTLDGKLQDSPDGSTDWQDITGATFTQVTDAGAAAEAISFSVNSARKFIRAVGTIAGGTPSFDFGIVFVGQKQVL